MSDKNDDFVTIHKGDKAWKIPKEWLQESDWNAKERQIARNKAEADIRNGKAMSREEMLSKFIEADDYSKADDSYKKLQHEEYELREKMQSLNEQYRQIGEDLKQESKVKPKSEWTTEDEISALLGEKPVSYTEKGLRLQKEYDEIRKQYIDIEHKWSDKHEQLVKIQKKYAKQEKQQWDKNKPEYKKGDVDTDYTGFATRTRSGYDHDLEKGIGFIAEMSPKEYLQRIAYDVFDSTWSHTLSGVSTDNIQKYMSMMKSGVKFDMPSIIEGSGQEGRHRAMAAYLLGIEKIPVYVRKK